MGRSVIMLHVAGVMTSVRALNKTDVHTLGAACGTLAGIMTAPPEQLAACVGMGPAKVKRLHDAFHVPFKRQSRLLTTSATAPAGSLPAAPAPPHSNEVNAIAAANPAAATASTPTSAQTADGLLALPPPPPPPSAETTGGDTSEPPA
jgi:hypothetical protein